MTSKFCFSELRTVYLQCPGPQNSARQLRVGPAQRLHLPPPFPAIDATHQCGPSDLVQTPQFILQPLPTLLPVPGVISTAAPHVSNESALTRQHRN
jgi:hypothetical protein